MVTGTQVCVRAGSEPEPEPEVSEGVPPQTLDEWLGRIGLSQYADAIKEYGYHQMSILQVATEEDIQEMVEDSDLAMKRPHRRAFMAEWKRL